MKPNNINHTKFWGAVFTKLFLVFLFTTLFSACQINTDNEDTGELSIELTDAQGDFSNYTVDVLSISLTKQNGNIVEVLPETTRVDFSQYVEMSEFLTLATVPRGVYTSAIMHLDYQNADIHVENAGGDSVQVNSITDENGEPITQLESNVSLEEHNQLRIVPGVPAHLSLDFDLKTSNVVAFDDQGIPSITVSPTLHASLEPELNKTHRLRGPLNNVDANNASFELIIRPFNHTLNKNERFGKLKVLTSDETSFEINDSTFTGAEGITALDALDKLSAVIVIGDISLNPRRFTATEVYAGSSVPGGTEDVVRGTVLNRAGNQLTVRGATLVRAGGSVFFNDNVDITLDSTTVVKRQMEETEYTIDDISIGQAVTIFGSLNEDAANPALDASEGFVRMTITSLNGTVAGSAHITEIDAPFEVNLRKINGKKIDLFDFSGTGVDSDNDANPEQYEIDTGALDTSAFTESLPVKVRGFVNSYGQAPADFIAKSVIGLKSVKAVMHTNWKPSSNSAFSQISNEGLVLDFTDSGKFHHIGRGHQKLDLTTLSTDFTVVSGDFDNVAYVIHVGGSKHVHSTFENFVADVEDQINQGLLVKNMKAKGLFDIVSGNFQAKGIRIHME